jgi:hypothetical protein
MTAIGFSMFIVGWLLVRTYGSPYESTETYNLADWVGLSMVMIGFVLANIGVFIKLWECMP